MAARASLSLTSKIKDAFFHPEYGVKTVHFWGPMANWGLVGSAVYDAVTKTEEYISMPMTATLLAYSTVFMRFAWMVRPRNYLLLSCHVFNAAAQSYQLYRGQRYQNREFARISQLPVELQEKEREKVGKPLDYTLIGSATAACLAAMGISVPIKKYVQTKCPPNVQKTLLHPAGPFTIHFYSPLFKWLLSISNILDYDRDVTLMSIPQQLALASTGIIWSHYSLVITPRNWSLFLVNFVLGLTGIYHLGRKVKYDYDLGKEIEMKKQMKMPI